MAHQFDVFISHASEDLNSVAAPLKAALEREQMKVWLDQSELQLGQSVTGKIADGIRDSRFVVAVLSRDFLRKQWPKRELEASLDKVLPVLHGITNAQLAAESPLVGSLKSVSWDAGEGVVVRAILDRLRGGVPKVESHIAVDLAHGQTDWDDLEDAIESRYPLATKLRLGFFEEDAILNLSRVLIIPAPRKYRFSRSEIDKVERWVATGGGLLLMGHYAERHHEMNISEMAWRFDLEFGDDVLLPAARVERTHARSIDPAYSVVARPAPDGHPLAADVREAVLVSSASVRSTVHAQPEFTLETGDEVMLARPLGRIDATGARVFLEDQIEDRRGPATVLAARGWKKGRVVAVGTWKLWTVAQGDNARLITNIVEWLAQPASVGATVAPRG
jgi:hypothetical protein